PYPTRFRSLYSILPPCFFRIQKLLFAFHTPAIPRKAAVLSDNSVTRDDDRDPVACAGPCHRANLVSVTEHLRDLAIADRLTVWDLSQQLPYLHLKRRRLDVEWKVEPLFPPRQMGQNLVNKFLEHGGIADDLGVGKLFCQIRFEIFIVVGEGNVAQPF